MIHPCPDHQHSMISKFPQTLRQKNTFCMCEVLMKVYISVGKLLELVNDQEKRDCEQIAKQNQLKVTINMFYWSI
jgi:hypothetical protein